MNEYLLCENCGNLFKDKEDIICCGTPTKRYTANNTEASLEKHIPIVSINDNMVTVKVGEIPHPMEENHYIKWIYLETTKGIKKFSLKPHDEPIATFNLEPLEQVISALAYCNTHGLWQNNLQ